MSTKELNMTEQEALQWCNSHHVVVEWVNGRVILAVDGCSQECFHGEALQEAVSRAVDCKCGAH